jgi:hypothetical protein
MTDAFGPERLEVERRRLEIAQERAAFEKRLSNRYFAVIATAVISLASLTLSYCQANSESARREKEMNSLDTERTREWNLTALKFVAEHSDVIYGADNNQRTRIRNIMIATFPPDITTKLFEKLEATATNEEERTTWKHQTISGDEEQVMVWVNTGSGVYHCPGSEWYQNTGHGTLMKQVEALKNGYRPARDNPCQKT